MSFDAVSPPTEPQLRLEIERLSDGSSRIRRHRAAFPWSFARGFRGSAEAGAPVLAIPQTAGAGVFGGETVAQEALVGPGAALHWRVPGALMIHPGRENGLDSRLDQRFSLLDGASMRLEGEPMALLPGARLHLNTVISVADGARFVSFEGVCPAQAGPMGFRLETRVERGGAVLFEDRQTASPEAVARLAALGWTAFGTVLALGPDLPGPEGALDLGEGVYAGAAPLRCGAGLGIRIAARDGGALRRAGRAAMEIVAKAAAGM